jgi:hypothetical protein
MNEVPKVNSSPKSLSEKESDEVKTLELSGLVPVMVISMFSNTLSPDPSFK